jgi:integrase
MASVCDEPNGRKRIEFGPVGARKRIRIGRVTEKQAVAFKVRVEKLEATGATGHPDDETAAWVAKLDDKMHARLAAVGLVQERQSLHLGPWLDKYLLAREPELKPESRRKLRQTTSKLLAYFDPKTALRAITPDQAADWRQYLVGLGLSDAAVKTHSGNAKTIFAEAVRRKLVTESVFENLRSGSTASTETRYITPIEADRIIDALPDAEWKLLFGLARYAGLRVPSESRLLTWADVDWERGRLNVRSPKTEHHAGHERRAVPITPKLMKLVQDRFDAAEPGEQRLVTMRGSGYVRRTLEAAIKRAGVEPWDKLFQACRSSCEQEWAMTFPQYAVSKWIGHSITVSGKHYANSVPDELFVKAADIGSDQAAHNPAQQAAELGCDDLKTKNPAFAGSRVTLQGLASYRKSLQDKDLEAGGIEPPSRDNSNGGLYMLIRCFNLDPGGGHRQSLPGSSRL